MKINSKKEKKYSTEVENNDQQNDSIFQEEGDYIINEMPKYKYEIKVIHESPNRANRVKTPDRTESSAARFTIINRPETNNRNNQNNIYFNKNHYASNSNINQLYKFKSIRTGPTIRFYSGNSSIQNDIRNFTFEKTFKYKKKHKRYNNKKIKHDNYYYINNNDNYYDNNYNYIIEIFPKTPCICQEEINKIINEYFKGKKMKKYIYNCGNECDICNRNKIKIYNENILKRDNYHSNISSPKKKYFKAIKIVKPINKVYYPKRANTPLNYNISKNNSYYNSNINTKRIVQNKYNNNIYIETSNISSPKTKNNELKKIKISKRNRNNNNITPNYSFISADNTPNYKNSPKDNSFINTKKYNRKNYLSPYYSKSQNLSNNFTNTIKSNRRKSNNIMINKSSEKYEKIKVIPIGQKINPLIVKKSVEKPVKDKIINEDGTTTNVIRQTTVITSIESKPIVNNNNSKDENLVKECITKIYTTLTKNVNENENENEIDNKLNENIKNKNNNNKMNLNKVDKEQNEEEKNLNIDNCNKENNNLNSNNKENNNINNNNNKEIIINPNNENKNNINNNLENNNDCLNHKNNNSSFNYSSIYSNNINDQNEQLNINRINDIVKYIKYLYYRCTNLTSYEMAKEESLSNYFLKLNYEEKKGVLNNLKDGNLENKKIYNKLISILDENYVELINDEEDEKLYKKKQGNILNKK